MNNYNNYYYDPQADAYRQAERRVKAKMGFYWHLASYVLVNGFLITIYLLTSWADNGLYYPWFIWPLLGWGIGLFFNFLAVFVFPDTPSSRQRMIEKELGAMGVSNYSAPVYPYVVPPVQTQAAQPDAQPVPPEKTPVG
ncbi:MAG: 2TM domain-containing protein [Chloroflexi bacterium]|nr:2TM domain-containing protein [Chloroflexota bacterium]OJV90235.1 MAG: hypothetical protein BGO39_02435 [Chloroflexi bacterium 54-19]